MNPIVQKTRNPSAFTLVELLVVISIVSILTLILTMSVRDALIRGKIAASKSNMKSLANAIEVFRLDHKVVLVDLGESGTNRGRDRISRTFGGVGLTGQNEQRNYGHVYAPLTTPVSYISEIPTDPFITIHIVTWAKSDPDLSNTSFWLNEYFHYRAFCDFPKDKPCSMSDGSGGSYAFHGCGPVVRDSVYCHYLYLNYNPSNGLHSEGSTYYRSNRGFSF